MNCLICLKSIKTDQKYHPACMRELFGDAKVSVELAKTRADLVQAMPKATRGFSISGVQIKAQLAVRDGKLQLVDSEGDFILKPSPEEYPFVAENEHLTLTLMAQLGIQVPPRGLIELKDGHLVFVIKRYDRIGRQKIHQEDAMQALGIANTDSVAKYTSASYYDALKLADSVAGRAIAKRLFDRLVFSYLVGNDDHHLKNISFILDKPYRLAPAYDVLSTALYGHNGDVMALKFFPDREPTYRREMGNGYYSGGDFVELAISVGIPGPAARDSVSSLVNKAGSVAPKLIDASRLPGDLKQKYRDVLAQRSEFLKVFA